MKAMSTVLKTMIEHSLLWVLFASVMLLPLPSRAQAAEDCDLNFSYEVQDTSGGRENGAIFITRLEGSGPFTVRLYDLLAAKREFEDTRQIEEMPFNKRIRIFDNISQGTYLIRVENARCSRSLSGIEGIVVK